MKNNYIVPELIGIPFNFIVIVYIIISYKIDIIVLAVGIVLATVSQILVLIPSLRKKGYRYEFILNIKDKYIKNMLFIAIPVIIGASVDQINVLVDRTLASNIAIG